MVGHNIRFKGVKWKIIPKLSLLLLLIWSSVCVTVTCMDPGVSYMNHLATSIYVLKSMKKTSHCGCSSWLPAARGKHTERYVNFITNFFISDDEGGMTELARIMIRDCKYDVSSPYLSCLLKYIYHYSFGLNNIY